MTLRCRLAALSTALLFAACQSGPNPTGTPAGQPTGASAAVTPGAASQPPPSAGPTPTAIPELLRLTVQGSAPVINHTDGPADSAYALPAAATRARDGSYVLLVVWFPTGNGPSVRTIATSEDGRTWRIGKDPILTGLGVGGTDPGPIPTALLQLDERSWQLFGWADDPMRSPHFTSWRASAARPAGPWTLDGAHVLETGEPGTWDSQTAGIRSVLRTDRGYAAWYEGSPPGNSLRGDLGYASSTDGLTWQKYNDPATTSEQLAASDPAVHRGICGNGTSLALFQPHVERDSRGYAMVFGGFGRSRSEMDLFGAVSDDGIHWSCGAPTALLRPEDIPGSEGTHTFTAFPLGDGRIGLLIEVLGEGHSDIWLATVERVG